MKVVLSYPELKQWDFNLGKSGFKNSHKDSSLSAPLGSQVTNYRDTDLT